jgi:hypothetical protein
VPAQVLDEGRGKRLNVTERRPQVMSQRGCERFQLLIGCGQLDIAVCKSNVQEFDLAFRPFALGNISDGAGNQLPLLGFKRAETDLHREFGAVLALSEELRPDPLGRTRGWLKKLARCAGCRPRRRAGACISIGCANNSSLWYPNNLST